MVGATGARPHETTEDEDRRHEIEEQSPEGRPAQPRVRWTATVALTAMGLIVLAVIAFALAFSGYPWAAVAVVGVGLMVVFIANPVFWVSILRARERNKVEHDHEAPREP